MQNSELCVTISSFSYRTGAPVYSKDHGGGFVFDCRCIPNPGRQPQFKLLTGRDAAVIEFLRDCPEAQSFKKLTFALVEQAVEHYIARGFNILEIAFGCTGGQHRSVYFAESLKTHLQEKYGVSLLLKHPSLKELGLL